MPTRYWSLSHGHLQPHSKSKAWQLSTQLSTVKLPAWLLTFSCASSWLPVFTLMITFVLISNCDYFDFGFSTHNLKVLSLIDEIFLADKL